MKKYLFTLMAVWSLTNTIQAQEFATLKIPAALRQHANVVIRDEQTEIKIQSKTKLIETYKIVFTILNKQGDRYSYISEYYDKSIDLSNLKVVLYDSLGVKIKAYDKKDFSDESRISGNNMYEDSRIKFLQIVNTKYPYSIEFSYTKYYNSNIYISSWSPQNANHVSIEKSSYKISYPQDVDIRWKESLLTKAEVLNTEIYKTRSYLCEKLQALEDEELSTGIERITPWAYFAPNQFAYENTQGDMTTWNSFGKWTYELSKDADKLPLEIAAIVHQLTDQVISPKEKTRILYHYLQSKTRYISVQLGIGGFKPFPAEKVATNGYGDCKALSNYMKALLKEASISSQLVVVKSGDYKDLWADFPSIGQTNHMILCVPMAKDTVWLECTSQTNPFNYLGRFTGNRNVILVSENGGKVVRTPALKPKDNYQIRKAEIKLSENGDAICKINTSYGGEQFEGLQHQLYQEPKEQKDYIYQSIGIPNPDIIDYTYQQRDKDIAQIEENISLKATKMLTGVGNNLFLTLNLMNKRQYIPANYKDRKTDFAINYGYYDKDEISYEVPENLKIDFVPQNQEIISEFGIYKIQTKIEDHKIIYLRELTMWKKQYPPIKFGALISFYKSIYKADKQKAVIVLQ